MALTKATYSMIQGASINVLDYGATGDGSTNDTMAVQAAIDAGSAQNKNVYFPAGTYSVSNLTHGTTVMFGDAHFNTTIIARDSGDSDYLIASPQWLATSSTNASPPTGFYNLFIVGNNFKKYALALRTYYTNIVDCYICNSTDTDLLFSSSARDGTALTGTMVNNTIQRCWLGYDSGTAKYNLQTIDPNGRCTDYHLIDCYLSSASQANLSVVNSAGWNIQGNHFYGSSLNAYIQKPNIGTTVVDNYFEEEVYLGGAGSSYYSATYGPGNFFLNSVWAQFSNNSASVDTIVSVGNTFGQNALLYHNYNDGSKILVSKNDVFQNGYPFRWYSNGTPQTNSVGVIRVEQSTFPSINRTLSFTSIGSTASATPGIMRYPATLENNQYQTPALLPSDNFNGYYPRVSKNNRTQLATNTPVTLTISAPELGDDDCYNVVVNAGQWQNHSGSVTTQYTAVLQIVQKASTNAHYVQKVTETITGGQWTAAPSYSVAVANGIVTLTITATPSTTDGYGAMLVQLNQ